MSFATWKSWLYGWKVNDIKDATHIGMSPTPGKFRIPPDEFFNRLAQANQAGVFPAVLEVRPEVFPLVIDLDFNAPDEGQTTALYDLEKGLRPFIKQIQTYYRKTFPNCPEVLNFYIQLRDAPYKPEGKAIVKDGIHIVCPELRATSADHLAARRKGLAEGWLKPILAKSLHTNAPEDVWDKSVLCDNNWFPIGCSKEVAPPYRLVGFFTSTGGVEMKRHPPKEEMMEDYARKCSFLLASSHPTLTSPIKESQPAEVAEEQEEAEQEEPEPAEASEPASVKTDPPASVSLTKVKNALNKLPVEWFESYKNWAKVIALVKGISPTLDYRNLVLKACRQPKRYDSDAHEKAGMDLWAKTTPRPNADASFNILKSIAKKESAEEKEDDAPGSQHDDPVYKAMKAKFEELVDGKPKNLKLMNPPCYMTLIGNEWFPRRPIDMDLCYGNMAWDKGYVHRKGWEGAFVRAWMDDPTIPTYERMDFYPAGDAPPNIFNTFTGLACDKAPVREAEPEEFPELLQLLRHLCEDDASYEYVLNLLAWRLQNLGRPVGVALCLAGGQGTGKDSFIGFVGERLIGDCYYRTSRPAHDLFGTFNAQLKDRLVIHIEEASGKDFIAKADDFKSLITSDKISLRLMNTNAYMTKFCGMFILSTNNLNPLKIEPDDRRFFIVNVKDHPLKQNKEFFTRFHEMTARPGVVRWFADLLRARDLSSFNLIHSRPATKAMEVGKALSTPPIANFLEAWCFHDPSTSHIRYGDTDDEVIVGSSDIYKTYQTWCQRDSLTEAYSQKKFVMNLKGLECPAITHSRTKEKSVLIIHINSLRKWLVDKNLCWDENHRNIINGVPCLLTDD